MSDTRLKLLAQSPEEIEILSAFLQDAVLKVEDLAYSPHSRRLVFVANRFRWEADGERQRVRCGFHLEDVTHAALKALPLQAPGTVLELLALECVPLDDGAATLTIIFAGGGAIRADVECIDATLEDLSEPWVATATPSHEI